MKFSVINRVGAIAAAAAVLGLGAPVAHATAVDPGIWYEFVFGFPPPVAATGCLGGGCTPSTGGNSTFVADPPWTFTAPAEGANLTVTDAFQNIDQFAIFHFGGGLIGTTSVPSGTGSCAGDGTNPDVCLLDPNSSHGSFFLAAGDVLFTIDQISPFDQDIGGAAYFRWDPAQAQVPEPGSLALLGVALAGIGWSVRRTRPS